MPLPAAVDHKSPVSSLLMRVADAVMAMLLSLPRKLGQRASNFLSVFGATASSVRGELAVRQVGQARDRASLGLVALRRDHIAVGLAGDETVDTAFSGQLRACFVVDAQLRIGSVRFKLGSIALTAEEV